jgi:hypothetical protein
MWTCAAILFTIALALIVAGLWMQRRDLKAVREQLVCISARADRIDELIGLAEKLQSGSRTTEMDG